MVSNKVKTSATASNSAQSLPRLVEYYPGAAPPPRKGGKQKRTRKIGKKRKHSKKTRRI